MSILSASQLAGARQAVLATLADEYTVVTASRSVDNTGNESIISYSESSPRPCRLSEQRGKFTGAPLALLDEADAVLITPHDDASVTQGAMIDVGTYRYRVIWVAPQLTDPVRNRALLKRVSP